VTSPSKFDDVIRCVDETFVLEAVRGALRIPSTSGKEHEVANYYRDLMAGTGLAAELQAVDATPMMEHSSVNVIGRLDSGKPGPTLLFNGHMDHNPVSDGWSKDPFGATVENGWIYGFVHMKAADACYIAAADAVRRSGIPLTGQVAIALVCGELRGGAGTRHALANGVMADHFILGEPTELQLATSHSASRVVNIHILGRTKHFATEETPDRRGINATEQAARVIAGLGRSHRPLKPIEEGGFLTFTPRKGFEGLPQFNIGPIESGIGRTYNKTRPALFPDVCTLVVDFRVIPGMTKESLHADLVRFLDRFKLDEPDFRYEIEFAEETFPLPFDARTDSPVVDAVAKAHRQVFGKAAEWSQVLRFAASDAAWMGAAGIPGVIYGPTGRYLSRPDERCEVADLIQATRVFACAIAEICGSAA
jgi:acetylornithine deacetylase